MPRHPYPILCRSHRFVSGARGLLHERRTVSSPVGDVQWRGGSTVVRIALDIGFHGWVRSGAVKRQRREGAYERLRANPVHILNRAANEGPIALARVIGQAAIRSGVGYHYSGGQVLNTGQTVVVEDDAKRLYGAFRGPHADAVTRCIPDWLRLLNAMDDPRYAETIDPEMSWLVPYTKRERALFPVSWNVDHVRVALWGALQLLLFADGGRTVDSRTQKDLVRLGSEMVLERYNIGFSMFNAAESLSEYARHDALWFTPPSNQPLSFPTWLGTVRFCEPEQLGLPVGYPVLLHA